MKKSVSVFGFLSITASLVAAPTANEDFVVAEDAKMFTNAVNAAKAYTDEKFADVNPAAAKRDKTDLAVYAISNEWTVEVVSTEGYWGEAIEPPQWDGDGWVSQGNYSCVPEPISTDPDATELSFRCVRAMESASVVARREVVPTGDRLATDREVAAAAADKATTNELGVVAAQVNAIGAYLNAEDARFVVTNYNSVTRTPEASMSVKVDGDWLEVWRETTRWAEFLPQWTNHNAYAFWDGVTGEAAPDGYFWIGSPRIALTGGATFARYEATYNASVWVLESNGTLAAPNIGTNGQFRIVDAATGEAQFEVVDDKEVLYANAASTYIDEVDQWHTTYVIANAAGDPTALFSRTLDPPNFIAQGEADCPCQAFWNHRDNGDGTATYTCTWIPITYEPQMFMIARYERGVGKRIVNRVPVEMEQVVIGGVKYTLGTATISGHTVITLTPAN